MLAQMFKHPLFFPQAKEYNLSLARFCNHGVTRIVQQRIKPKRLNLLSAHFY